MKYVKRKDNFTGQSPVMLNMTEAQLIKKNPRDHRKEPKRHDLYQSPFLPNSIWNPSLKR